MSGTPWRAPGPLYAGVPGDLPPPPPATIPATHVCVLMVFCFLLRFRACLVPFPLSNCPWLSLTVHNGGKRAVVVVADTPWAHKLRPGAFLKSRRLTTNRQPPTAIGASAGISCAILILGRLVDVFFHQPMHSQMRRISWEIGQNTKKKLIPLSFRSRRSATWVLGLRFTLKPPAGCPSQTRPDPNHLQGPCAPNHPRHRPGQGLCRSPA